MSSSSKCLKRVRTSSQPSSPLPQFYVEEKQTSEDSSRKLLETSACFPLTEFPANQSSDTIPVEKASPKLPTSTMPLTMSSAGINHRFKCVYGKRLGKNNIIIYLHRLKDGGWIEHDEFDTCFQYNDIDITKVSSFDYWEPVDYPPFFSSRARFYHDWQVEGVNSGNVRIKPRYFSEYKFDFS